MRTGIYSVWCTCESRRAFTNSGGRSLKVTLSGSVGDNPWRRGKGRWLRSEEWLMIALCRWWANSAIRTQVLQFAILHEEVSIYSRPIGFLI